jgi:hypothetical protein
VKKQYTNKEHTKQEAIRTKKTLENELIKNIKQLIRKTKSKRHKASSKETKRQQEELLYSNPHAYCITVSP